jgi:hypothetical protein
MHQHEFEWGESISSPLPRNNAVVGVHTAGKRTVPLDLFYLVSDVWLQQGNRR